MKIINYVRKNKAVFIAFLTLAWPTVLEELLSTVIQRLTFWYTQTPPKRTEILQATLKTRCLVTHIQAHCA